MRAAAIVSGAILGAAVLAAASFEVVTGAGAGWSRIPAGLVVVAFAVALGWVRTRPDDGSPDVPAAKPATGYGFAGAEDPELEAIVVRAR